MVVRVQVDEDTGGGVEEVVKGWEAEDGRQLVKSSSSRRTKRTPPRLWTPASSRHCRTLGMADDGERAAKAARAKEKVCKLLL
jgi:hypothetical protein